MSCDAITVHKSRAMGMTEFQHRHLKTSTGFDLGPRLDDKEAWDALLATPLYQSKLAELMEHAHQAAAEATAIPRLLIVRNPHREHVAEMKLRLDSSMEQIRREICRIYSAGASLS